jgi:hypothetical protein
MGPARANTRNLGRADILIDTAGIPGLLAARGVEARVVASFGVEALPEGLRAVVGQREG